jgi:hypothetical protein
MVDVIRSKAAAILLAFLVLLATPMMVAAQDSPDSEKNAGSEGLAPATAAAAQPEPNGAVTATLGISFVAYAGILSTPDPALVATRPRTATSHAGSANETSAEPLPVPPAPQRSDTVVSTAPMTAGEKFGAWARTFISPGNYVGKYLSGMFSELQDDDDFKKDTVKNFFADSATRAARGLASSSTRKFYADAVLASLLKQDPRYHRLGKGSAKRRMIYALTRVFVTQGDRCACHQFNASFLLGTAGAAVTSNLWERRERTGPFHTFRRFYQPIYFAAFGHLIAEFVGGQ